MPDVRLPPDVCIAEKLTPLSESVSWADSMLGAEEAWKLSEGEGITVCILDTGCDASHPDLAGAIKSSRDFTNSRYGPADKHGHGTHVSGLVGARSGNDIGIRGMAPKCRLLIAKVLGDSGGGDDDGISRGIEWGLGEGADVFSLSLGGGGAMPRTQAVVESATKSGNRFFLAAAGNDGGAVNYPAKYASFISVGAYNEDGELTDFTSKVGRLDICGPGTDMLSCLPGGRYGTMTGTSQATPIVAAITALAVAKHRKDGSDTDLVTMEDLREHLQKSAVDRGSYRLANARKLLEEHGVAPPSASPLWIPKIQFSAAWALCKRG